MGNDVVFGPSWKQYISAGTRDFSNFGTPVRASQADGRILGSHKGDEYVVTGGRIDGGSGNDTFHSRPAPESDVVSLNGGRGDDTYQVGGNSSNGTTIISDFRGQNKLHFYPGKGYNAKIFGTSTKSQDFKDNNNTLLFHGKGWEFEKGKFENNHDFAATNSITGDRVTFNNAETMQISAQEDNKIPTPTDAKQTDN